MQDEKEMRRQILKRIMLDNEGLDVAMDSVGSVDLEDLYAEQKEPKNDIEMGRKQLTDYLRSKVEQEIDRDSYYEKGMEPRRARAKKLLGIE